MVNLDTALGQNLLEIAIGHTVSDVEKHGMEDDTLGKMGAFERNRGPYLPHGQIRRPDKAFW
jgi:hypothetical protein